MTSTSCDGVLLVHKPVGPSSHDIVVIARRSLGVKRIGHTGTLDPQASGVLPLVVGQATRLAQHLTGSDKEYLATLQFGVVTDTRDVAGTVLATSDALPALEAVRTALAGFTGRFEQTPPAYSAKMVDGERAYARARAGKPVAPAAATVVVQALDLLHYEPPLARVRVRCSAGFYVRSLAHDVGQVIGCGAILAALVRTEAAGFGLDEALPLEMVVTAPREQLRAAVRPMEALMTSVPAVEVTEEGLDWVRHGRDLGPRQCRAPLAGIPPLTRLLGPDGRLVGLADRSKVSGFLHPTVVFSYN